MSTLNDYGFLSDEIRDWIDKYRSDYSDLFKLSDDVNELCQKLLFETVPEKHDLQKMIMAPLYARALELFQSVILLSERGMMVESRIIVRVLSDTTFQLKAIKNDKEYARDYVLVDQLNRLKYLNKYKTLHGGLPEEIDSDEVKKLEHEIKESIGEEEIKRISSEEWAKRAGMHDWYQTVYSLFSDSVHSNVRDLERNIIHDKENIKEFKFGPDDFEIEKTVTSAITAILLCLDSVNSIFSLKKESEIQALVDRNNTLVTALKDK